MTDGAAPINPSVGAQAIEVAKFKIEANGDNDLSFSQAVFTFTGTINRSEVTNLNLYLLGESASLASVSGIDTNDTFTMTLSSPYVITKGFTKTFLLRADLAGEVAQTLKIYIDETNHLVISDNQYNFGALVDNGFDTGDAATLTLQGGEITLTDNGPSADSIAKNQQDVVLAKIAMTAERAVEVRKLFITLATSTFNNPTDGVSDLRIKDEDTGQTLMTLSTSLPTGSDIAADYLMTGTFNLTAGTTRILTITVDIGVDTGDVLNDESVTADLKIVDRGDDTIATGATNEEAQMRDVITGDWVLTADIIPLIVSGNAQTIEDATLTITESSTPVTGLAVVKGASNVEAIGFVLTSGDASTSLIRQLAARVYVNSANDFAKATEDTSPNGEVISVALYDGGTKLSEKTITSTSSSGHDYGAVIFDNLNVFIEAGANKKLTIMFNVSASAAASFVAIGVLPGDIVAYDSDGNDITVTASAGEVNVYVDDSNQPNNSTEIKASGELTMSIDASSPDADIVLAGTSDVVMSKIKLTATNESWTVNKLRILIGTTGNEGSISSVKIAFPGGTATGFLASGFVNFTGLDWVIEADTEEILTITADLATIDPNIATTGRELKFGIDEEDGFEAVG